MKKKINFLSGLASLCVFAFMLAGLASCNNIAASLNQGGVVIEGLSAQERTVLANTSPSDDFTNIELYGSPANGTERKISAWNTYESMINSTEVINLDAGVWSFTLKAKRYGASFSQTLTDKVVSTAYTTTLNFNELALTTDSEGKGKVHVEFTFPSSLSGLSSCKAVFGDDEEITLTKTDSSYLFEKASVEDGSYLLTFKGLNAAGSVIFTYPTYVVVKKGYISSDSINANQISSITKGQNTPVKVTYKMNYASDTTADYEQTYNKGSSILNYSAAGFTAPENCVFVTWATTTTLAGYRGTDFNAYDFGAQPSFTEDTDLYAIWLNKSSNVLVSYYLNGESEENYVEILERSTTSKFKTLGSASADNQLVYTKTGYEFLGWDTNEDYTGDRYDSKNYTLNEVPSDKSVLKLYAVWVSKSGAAYMIKNQKDFDGYFNSEYIGATDRIKYVTEFYFDEAMNNQTIDTTRSRKYIFRGHLYGQVSGTINIKLTSRMFYDNAGTIENLVITGNAINDDAAIVLTNYGTIQNCTVLADVKGTNNSQNVGAICAVNTIDVTNNGQNFSIGQIESCYVSSTVSNTNAGNLGGITGQNLGIIKKCKNYTVDESGKVTAATIKGMNNVGGIAGANSGEITYCKSAATVTGSGDFSNIGGIAGYNGTEKGCLAFCYFWGSVGADKSIQGTNVGGLIGKSEMTAEQKGTGSFTESNRNIKINYQDFSVYACGVAGTLAGGKYAGGLIGYNVKSAAVNSYAAIEKCSYYPSLGQGSFAGLYAYCENPVWIRCYVSKENGELFYGVKAPEQGWFFDSARNCLLTTGETIATKKTELLTATPTLTEVTSREPGDSDKIPLYVEDAW